VTLAGLTNALKIVGKRKEDIRLVVNGAGAAGMSITRLLLSNGIKDITICDRTGAIFAGREKGMNPVKEEMAALTNPRRISGSLAEAVRGADVFIGVSAPGVLTTAMVATMAEKPIIFACANPTPEIFRRTPKPAGRLWWRPDAATFLIRSITP
jgi:malate dehydrogenase (oxaloacetate-decarboxylating)